MGNKRSAAFGRGTTSLRRGPKDDGPLLARQEWEPSGLLACGAQHAGSAAHGEGCGGRARKDHDHLLAPPGLATTYPCPPRVGGKKCPFPPACPDEVPFQEGTGGFPPPLRGSEKFLWGEPPPFYPPSMRLRRIPLIRCRRARDVGEWG